MRITQETLASNGSEAVIIALAQNIAKNAAASVADLTDNSGGAAANGTITDIPLASAAPSVGANVPTKAATETAFSGIRDGLTEIAAKIVAIAARVPAFTPANNIGGAAADGTIAAITIAPTADNTGPRVSRTGFNALATAYRNRLRELIVGTNQLAVACGLAKLTGNGGGSNEGAYDQNYAVLTTDTGTAASDSSGSVTVAQSTATLTGFRDAIAELAAKLNSITTDAAPAAKVIVA